MKLEQALSITDLRRLAKRRLPRVLFEAIESGVLSGLREAPLGHRIAPYLRSQPTAFD
jgi:hypothetical protein